MAGAARTRATASGGVGGGRGQRGAAGAGTSANGGATATRDGGEGGGGGGGGDPGAPLLSGFFGVMFAIVTDGQRELRVGNRDAFAALVARVRREPPAARALARGRRLARSDPPLPDGSAICPRSPKAAVAAAAARTPRRRPPTRRRL